MRAQRPDQQVFGALRGLMAGGGDEFHLRHVRQKARRAMRQMLHVSQKSRLRGDAISCADSGQKCPETAAGKGQMPRPSALVKCLDRQSACYAAIRKRHKRNGLFCRKFRACGRVPAHVFGPEFLSARLACAAHPAPDIQFPLFQQVCQMRRQPHGQRDLKRGMGGAEGAENFGKARQEQVFRHAQPDRPARRVLPEAGQDAVLALQKLSGQTDQRHAVCGQTHAFGAAGQQARAKLFLQPADMLADGGLTHSLALRG